MVEVKGSSSKKCHSRDGRKQKWTMKEKRWPFLLISKKVVSNMKTTQKEERQPKKKKKNDSRATGRRHKQTTAGLLLKAMAKSEQEVKATQFRASETD